MMGNFPVYWHLEQWNEPFIWFIFIVICGAPWLWEAIKSWVDNVSSEPQITVLQLILETLEHYFDSLHLNPPSQTLRSSVLWGWIRGWRNVGWRRTHQVETEGVSVYVDERSRFSFWAEMYFLACTFLRWLPSFLLQVENTIRWRAKRDEEGNETRESNARIVKWSDGRCVLSAVCTL